MCMCVRVYTIALVIGISAGRLTRDKDSREDETRSDKWLGWNRALKRDSLRIRRWEPAAGFGFIRRDRDGRTLPATRDYQDSV